MDASNFIGNIIVSVPVLREDEINSSQYVSICSFTNTQFTFNILVKAIDLLENHDIKISVTYGRTIVISSFSDSNSNDISGFTFSSCTDYNSTIKLLYKAIDIIS